MVVGGRWSVVSVVMLGVGGGSEGVREHGAKGAWGWRTRARARDTLIVSSVVLCEAFDLQCGRVLIISLLVTCSCAHVLRSRRLACNSSFRVARRARSLTYSRAGCSTSACLPAESLRSALLPTTPTISPTTPRIARFGALVPCADASPTISCLPTFNHWNPFS